MKILNVLKNLILEISFRFGKAIENDGREIIFFQSRHQKDERRGNEPIPENIGLLVMNGKYHSGVNTGEIRKSVKNNFDIIFNFFMNPPKNVKTDKTRFIDYYEDEPDIYIEYVLGYEILNFNSISVTVITSAFSVNGDYFSKVRNYKDFAVINLTES